MTTSTPEKQDGLKALQDAIDKIKEVIATLGGVFTVQMAVRNCNIYAKGLLRPSRVPNVS